MKEPAPATGMPRLSLINLETFCCVAPLRTFAQGVGSATGIVRLGFGDLTFQNALWSATAPGT